MNRSISTLLTTLLFSAVIVPTAASAQTSLNPQVTSQPLTTKISPFNLVYLAYQGHLKNQGIPSYGAFINASASGTVTAQDLMQAAVKANQLSEQMLTDRGYRSALENALNDLPKD